MPPRPMSPRSAARSATMSNWRAAATWIRAGPRAPHSPIWARGAHCSHWRDNRKQIYQPFVLSLSKHRSSFPRRKEGRPPSTALQALRTGFDRLRANGVRSEEHTSELQSLMRISYAVFCLKKKNTTSYKCHDHYVKDRTYNI